ncbi:MAG: hypothetical protein Hals2KO_02580 [Halioglobus sp.]
METLSLRQERGDIVDAMSAILDTAESKQRDLTDAEQDKYNTLNEKQSALKARIERLEHAGALNAELDAPMGEPTRPQLENARPKGWVDVLSGKSVEVYDRGECLQSSPINGPGLGDIVKGMFLGPKGNADIQNALSVGTDSAGGYHVPEHLARSVIEAMRNKLRTVEAGAQTVLLPAHDVHMTRVATEPTPSWRAESAAVSESDPTFERVTFSSNSLDMLIKCSLEIMEDAIDFDSVVLDLLASCIAREIDRAALFGSGASNQPTGLFNQSNVLEVDLGTNGDTLAQADLRTALSTLSANNAAMPTGAIMAPRTYFDIDAWADTTGQPIQLSPAIAAVPFLETNQVPIDQSHGTANDASCILMGDYSQMMIGVRTELQIQIANELYRANGQVGFFARARYDVQLRQPKAFCKVTGITP